MKSGRMISTTAPIQYIKCLMSVPSVFYTYFSNARKMLYNTLYEIP